MSQIIDLLNNRLATRSISSESLPPQIVDELIEAARLTPSCFNNQPWRYLFISGQEALAKGRETLATGNQAWAARAPLLIIGYTRVDDDCVIKDRAYHQFDLGLSVMNIILAATEHGLVARPMAGFSPSGARKAFGLATIDQPFVAIAVGKPSTEEDHLPDRYRGIQDKARERKPADEIVTRL